MTERLDGSSPGVRRSAIAGSALVFGLVAPTTYALERAYEWLRGEGGDPRLVLRTLHTVYFWRVAIAVWWGLLVAFVAYSLLCRSGVSDATLGRVLQVALVVLLPALVLFCFLVP